ncbi:MAG TPA: hypothetical protein VGA53_00415 [Candidatus Paceibacterota bacterium]
MEKLLKDYYTKNKIFLEVTAFLLVISGLFLNIPDTEGTVGKSLQQLKFFSLVLSSSALFYLLYRSVSFFIAPLIEKALEVGNRDGGTVEDLQKRVQFLLAIIAGMAFIAFMTALFAVNLLIYVVFSFPREFLFLSITIGSNLVLIFFSSKLKYFLWARTPNLAIFFVFTVSFLLAVGVPLGVYILLYLKLGLFSFSSVMLLFLVVGLSCVVSYRLKS